MRSMWGWPALLAVGLMACAGEPPAPEPVGDLAAEHCMVTSDAPGLDLAQEPCAKLSSYHFMSLQDGVVTHADGVVPYDMSTPLFTDYAHKFRAVWMPEGEAASFSTDATFTFPVGTVLLKTFAYPLNYAAPDEGVHVIETRLLVHYPEGWRGLPYVWNDEQTEAYYDPAGLSVPVTLEYGDGSTVDIDYLVPNGNQCKGCHEATGHMGPIGPKARFLNAEADFGGAVANQIDRWVQAGYLSGVTDTPPALDAFDTAADVEERVRAYLDINCAHCHNPRGPARTSGLMLEWSPTPVTERTVDQQTSYGICKTPVAAGRGSGGLHYDIVPGDPDASILVFRMESNDPGIMMPELGRSVAHEEGVALVREWIAAMAPRTCAE